MNPETNRFEPLHRSTPYEHETSGAEAQLCEEALHQLVRPDGSPIPKHWSTFAVGELVEIKDYTFQVKYIGETAILFEPVSPEDAAKMLAPGG